MENPVIVVVAYNKKFPFKRLLRSLTKAKYPKDVKLIISIDKGGSSEVEGIAKEFSWDYGKKEIISQNEHLGLRNHIINCGDLTKEFESVILLEDDLFVSPMFYDYTSKALEFYRDDQQVAGISLYAQSINMLNGLPFLPINDGTDVFFLQIPCSWGEAWSRKQWFLFKKWYENLNKEKISSLNMPSKIHNWPETSWAKYFWMFLVNSDKYFVYPRNSLTTQFGEVGLHSTRKTSAFQVPLQLLKEEQRFILCKDSLSVYDAFYEILPSKLNSLTNIFEGFDPYTVDLNGLKSIDMITTDLLLTSKRCKNFILTFGMEMKPVEMNIITNMFGKKLFLSHKEFVNEDYISRFIRHQKEFNFYYRGISVKRSLIFALLKTLGAL